MSTKKTEHLGLHAWEPQDEFLRSEFNENFQKLDGILVTGSYMGDGKGERRIDLGFKPAAVLLCNNTGQMGFAAGVNQTAGGLFFEGCPIDGTSSRLAAEVTETGFRVRHIECNQVNAQNTRYHYLALR